ncbi:TetR family transcriptional regulator [Gordonia sp. SID5947]|uniref:TetR/AcrR family transcriptional regulator n=1 Tax=Gordonia sp. SID5947 TaxID=2690315 RepID=UPI00136C406F|nr:TetR/AcrR family transcriptional regulator [Gordonia sp. SID5947]MYR07997.1 TetR family transcriptional regulator [Gordonia sp. SID5947]
MNAARDSFVEVGFTRSSIADVVERAGSSVGSIYHHFGGKAELFVALFEDFDRRTTAVADAATDDARAQGITDPVELFVAGARAYLEYTRDNLAESRLFASSSDVPPGFDILINKDSRVWQRRTQGLLSAMQDDDVESAMLPTVLTAIVVAGVQELITTESVADTAHSERIIDTTIAYVRRAGTRPD